jgi:hypothetical protein
MARCLTKLLVVIAALTLGGCAGYAPTDELIGKPRDEVLRIMGQPSTELDKPDGRVLIYSRGPYGKHTYFVHLNGQGKALQWSQVLNEKNFDRITPGMSRDAVVSIIGESKIVFLLARDRGYVWSYRFINPYCFWFQIEFAKDDTVRSSGYGKPPECRAKGSS